MTLAEFAGLIAAERARQDAKHPDCGDLPDSHDNPRARQHYEQIARGHCDRAYREGRCTFADVLDEEAAEALTAAARGDIPELRKELVQVSAVCLRWLEAIDRREQATSGEAA